MRVVFPGVCITFDEDDFSVAAVVECRQPDAVEFVRTRLGFEPDARQCEVLLSGARRGILNCSRQWGKSTVAAAKAVHRRL